jgi:cyclophilin family peptidyl-prolyl cis-trans isomerase
MLVVLGMCVLLTATNGAAQEGGTPAAPAAGGTPGAAQPGSGPVVLIKTSMGDIKVQLDKANAPVTVENFVAYANGKFYDGTIFHRVIPDFMIQGGGFDKDMNQKKTTRPPIKNEAGNGLKNTLGTIAMARTSDPNSATAQFFINTKDNPFLDHRDESARGFGYAVFGTVVEGIEVVQKIEKVPTGTRAPHENVPNTPVIIESIRVVE